MEKLLKSGHRFPFFPFSPLLRRKFFFIIDKVGMFLRQSYEAAYHFKEVSFLIMRKPGQNPRILVADDSEMNRAILEEMLGGEYDILQAETAWRRWR